MNLLFLNFFWNTIFIIGYIFFPNYGKTKGHAITCYFKKFAYYLYFHRIFTPKREDVLFI